MAYFNHAFSKMFLGTGTTLPDPLVTPLTITTDGGFITQPNVPTGATTTTANALANLPVGYFGFFNPQTYLSVDASFASDNTCCPLILASSSVLTNDKIGPFHGGYKETNKSKVINPRYIQRAYTVFACAPQQTVVSVGNTPQTNGSVTLDPNNFQGGTTEATCCFEFLCGETYYLRIDVKGSPALRALNHNAYQTVSAYTGCCAGPTPTPVDSTLVMIEWARAIVINNYLKDFVLPVVFDEAGAPWYAPGTTVDPITGLAIPTIVGGPNNGEPQTWNFYISPGHVVGACAGLRLFGAFVETRFGNCTFQVTDYFEREPVKVYAAMVDYNGDPCVFEGICVYNDCLGLQGMGFGEQVVRDLIKAESYLQNFFHSGDFRVREITQGYDMTNAINRNALYTRYYLLHSVPRFNNPTGVFDNDRYLLEIIIPETNVTPTNPPVGNSSLDTFLATWLQTCAGCVTLEPFECTYCTPEPNVVPVP